MAESTLLVELRSRDLLFARVLPFKYREDRGNGVWEELLPYISYL